MVCYKTMISNFIMKFVLSFLLVLFKSLFSKFSIKLFALWFDLDSRLCFFHFSPMLIRGSIPGLPPPLVLVSVSFDSFSCIIKNNIKHTFTS